MLNKLKLNHRCVAKYSRNDNATVAGLKDEALKVVFTLPLGGLTLKLTTVVRLLIL